MIDREELTAREKELTARNGVPFHKFKGLRVACGYATQTLLSNATGLSRGVISKHEQGRFWGVPRRETLKVYARAFNIDVNIIKQMFRDHAKAMAMLRRDASMFYNEAEEKAAQLI